MKTAASHRCSNCGHYPMVVKLGKVAPQSDVELFVSWTCKKCRELNEVTLTIIGDDIFHQREAEKKAKKDG